MVDRENISRYFAAYPVPTEPSESKRLLSTTDRILRSFAGRLQEAASANARAAGSSQIAPTDVARAIAETLPHESTPYKTVVFFPAAGDDSRLEVESIDLEAFASTPFPWGALIGLTAETETAGANGTLPWAQAAAPMFAQAVSDYGLLLLRLGGQLARAEYARELGSPHLRQAERELAERARGPGAESIRVETPPEPSAGSGTDFVDVTAQASIRFRHVSSDWLARFRRFGPFTPTFSGGGVSAGDLDGDSLPDLVFCGGEGCAVYRNRGDATFEDITASSGLVAVGEARMAVLADLDNDGDRDALITFARDGNRLFENLGGGRFRDISEAAGLRSDGSISGPAIAFDFDNDGLLDLYLGNFGDYLEGEAPWQASDNRNAQANRLYRNRGALRFEDVTEAAGAGNTGWAQAISHVDYNLDGYQDIYIANDFGRNELLENLGNGTFASRGAATGTDDEFHGMNVAFSDLNQDRYPDILITNIWGWVLSEPGPGEFNKLLLSTPSEDGPVYRATNSAIPEFESRDTGWSWGALFFDADNDGDEDLYVVNGHTDYSTFVQYRPHPTRDGAIYPINNGREANLFFLNQEGELRVPAQPTGAELGDLNSRSVALLDYDMDGDLDMAVSTFHEHARLFRNDLAPRQNHWLEIELVGDPTQGASLDAIGTQLIARSDDGFYAWRTVTGGDGYLSMSTLPLEIGLGVATSVDLEIYWPGRRRQDVRGVPGSQRIRVRQGRPGFELVSSAPATHAD